MVKRIFSGLIAILVLGWPGQAAADEVIASHEGLTATVIGAESCGPILRILVNAPGEGAFDGDRAQLSALLKAIRTRLTFDCPEAEDVLIEGEVEGRKVYRGAFSKGTGWALVDLTPPKSAVKPPKEQEPVKQAEQPPVDKTELVSLTLRSCETKYKASGFCICAMEQLTKIDLSLAEWELISRDFSNVVEISKTNQEIKKGFRACYG